MLIINVLHIIQQTENHVTTHINENATKTYN